MHEADSVEIITLADNYVNGFLQGSEGVNRPRLDVVSGERPGEPLLAEFGWSALVRVKKGGHVYPILFDTGVGKQALVRNAKALKLDLRNIDSLVLSHGHWDHTAATPEVVTAIGRDDLPLVLHPNALRKTVLLFPNGNRFDAAFFLDEKNLHDSGASLLKSKRPTPLASDSALVTGEIPRVTAFEKGMPPNMHYRIVDGDLVHDPLILDDQGLVVNVKGKGLVVVSGCAHAGIVNTVEYAKQISGTDRVHAVIGGFHLTGAFFAPIIDKTVAEMARISPKVIIPSHCTGLRGLVKIVNAFPDAFVENSVGTIFQF